MAYPKISEHFLIPEVVPPEVWNAWGEKSIWFIDRRIINAAEEIRTYFNVPMFINTWHWGGQYKERGFRSFNTTTGAQFSQHKFGRALDFSFTNITSGEVFEVIKKKWADFGITTVEQGTVGWTHVDVRDTGMDELFEVRVVDIFRMSKLGFKQREIGAKYSIGQQTVSNILLGKSWKHLEIGKQLEANYQ